MWVRWLPVTIGGIMSDQELMQSGNAQQVFMDLLEESGFFKQINALEESLQIIASELKIFSQNATERRVESESLAAHVLACESILAVMLKSYPVSAADLKAEVMDRTAAMSGNEDGSPTVHALAMDVLEKSER